MKHGLRTLFRLGLCLVLIVLLQLFLEQRGDEGERCEQKEKQNLANVQFVQRLHLTQGKTGCYMDVVGRDQTKECGEKELRERDTNDRRRNVDEPIRQNGGDAKKQEVEEEVVFLGPDLCYIKRGEPQKGRGRS